MIIEIDQKDLEKLKSICNDNEIEISVYNNVYWETCREEIDQAIGCSDSLLDDEEKSFYDIAGDKADDIIYDMINDLYNCVETNDAFDELARAAQLIVNRKIYSLKEENK